MRRNPLQLTLCAASSQGNARPSHFTRRPCSIRLRVARKRCNLKNISPRYEKDLISPSASLENFVQLLQGHHFHNGAVLLEVTRPTARLRSACGCSIIPHRLVQVAQLLQCSWAYCPAALDLCRGSSCHNVWILARLDCSVQRLGVSGLQACARSGCHALRRFFA